ncbi:hypothetical protein [Streptococcus marmotae]|uniref:hypothetical protein n=1 Tax=Streptococcus marmotae TaxID=1825069 RepID=UPI00082C2CAB|nr:hypothetical protein [Streptococcus marmotae]QBX16887.1 hypothetical protein Javan291_0011 [Streptococcus phage Javan291]
MSYNQVIADKILEFAKLEPTTPAGTAHDFRSDEFDQDDFRDTAKKLILTGQISAKLQEDYSGLFIEFRQ